MRVALSEGRISKWQSVLQELTHHDFQVLQAYYHIEPWGEDRADLREATMASVIVCGMTGAEVDPNELKDYLRVDETKEKRKAWPSPNSVAASMRQMHPGL